MTTYENATIITKDESVKEALIKIYSDTQYYFPTIEGDKFIIRNQQGQTHKELLKISEQHDAEIEAEYSFESNRHSLIFKVKIEKGVGKLADVEINYSINYSDRFKLYIEEETQKRIIEELDTFYKKIDSVKVYEDGSYCCNLNEDKKVSLEFQVDEYEIISEKRGDTIEILSFRYIKNF